MLKFQIHFFFISAKKSVEQIHNNTEHNSKEDSEHLKDSPSDNEVENYSSDVDSNVRFLLQKLLALFNFNQPLNIFFLKGLAPATLDLNSTRRICSQHLSYV